MDKMEQALRDEIAWHRERLDGGYLAALRIADQHEDRLAALTAALPAPVEAGDWVMVPRVATEAMQKAGYEAIEGVLDPRRECLHEDDMAFQADAWSEMLAAALAASVPEIKS